MNESECMVLAMVAMGWLSIDNQGQVWTHVRWNGGRKGGTSSMRMMQTPTRADTGRSAKDGYLRVQPHFQGKRRIVAAHRIVWMIVNRRMIPDGLEVNHKNGKKWDNRPENLEVVTRAQNCLHAGRVLGVLGKGPQKGERNPGAKLKDDAVREIRRLWACRAMTQQGLADLFGLAQTTVSNICLRQTWKHLE